MIKKSVIALTLLVVCSTSFAENTLKPFYSGSLAQIEKARKGQAFVVVLWSIDCPPCLKELALLQQLKDQFSEVGLVLIAADNAEYTDSAQALLTEFKLEKMDNWIFADSTPERLRYSIDPAWYGELPRAYFYDKSHQRFSHSGSLKKAQLQKWLLATQ
ncbi:MAG: redoxin domain-containing protein [Pseudomonadales bacterium]|nr:redoxin domain-containing protein [Pseudomonadales bacterium]